MNASSLQPSREPASHGAEVLALLVLWFLSASAFAASPVTTNSVGGLVLINSFGDLNGDGGVDVLDVVSLTLHLDGTQLLPAPLADRADLDQNGAVNAVDRRILADLIAARHTQAADDFDEDELSNLEEVQRGTRPLDPDTDHDGSLDGWEILEGTDPLDPLSRLSQIVVARPPVQIIHPLIQDTDTNAPGPTVARPPIQVIFPAFAEGEEAGAITVARPPVQIVHPLLQDTDTNAPGPFVARPPVLLIHPLIQDTDTNAPGPFIARPPVKVIKPAP